MFKHRSQLHDVSFPSYEISVFLVHWWFGLLGSNYEMDCYFGAPLKGPKPPGPKPPIFPVENHPPMDCWGTIRTLFGVGFGPF